MTDFSECNIDKIMYLISWKRSEAEQQEGIAMARNVSCLKAFCQPSTPKYGKDVWENCAIIICERSDIELEHIVLDMILWLEDLNWPGAEQIQERLGCFQRVDTLAMYLNSIVPVLGMLNKRAWLSCLSELLCNAKLKNALTPQAFSVLNEYTVS